MKPYLKLFLALLLALGVSSVESQVFNFTMTISNGICLTTAPATILAVQTASSAGANTYTWVALSSNTACPASWTLAPGIGTAAVFSFSCCGTYTIYHYAYMSGNPSPINTAMQTFTVFCSPPPTLTLSNSSANTTVCPGAPVTLSASGANSYYWSNGTFGPSITVNPSVTTTYSVIGTNSFCPSASYPTTVSVMSHPPLALTLPGYACSNGSCFTISASLPGGTYSGNSAVFTSGMFCPMLALPGTNTVNYTVNYGGCQLGPINSTIVVYPFVPAALTTSVIYLCYNSNPFNLNAVVQGTPLGSWSGAFVSGTYFSIPLSLPNNTTSVLYTVGTNPNQLCSDSQSLLIHVGYPPQPTVTLPGSFCSTDLPQQLTVSPFNSGSWITTPYLSTTGVFTPALAGVGNHTVQYVTGTPSCSLSDSKTVAVLPVPVLSVSGNARICLGETTTLTVTGATTYTWSNASTNSFVVASPPVSTLITVTGELANLCKSTTGISLEVLPCVGVQEEAFVSQELILFPNPAQSYVSVKPSDTHIDKFYLYTSFGLLLLEQETGIQTGFDIAGLPDGLYLVVIKASKTTYTKKLIIKR